MPGNDNTVNQAKSYAARGLLCSESVLLAISGWLGIRSELIPKIATGFGAGIGGRGSVCGAISGGVMALGLRLGREDPTKKERASYKWASELITRFEKEFGHLNCRELTGCDFTTEADRRKYSEEKMWETRCRQYIARTTAIVLDMLSKPPEDAPGLW